MYSIKVSPTDKTFLVAAEGGLTAEEGTRYLKELKEKIASINPSNYVLVLDGSKVDTSSQEGTSMVEEANQLFFSTPFKKRFMIVPNSAIAKMQLKRVGKDNINTVLDYVDSYEEALKKM